MATTLKNRIMKYRAKHDLTQVEFAARVGISPTTLGLIEQGKKQNLSRLTEAKIKMVLSEPDETYNEEV